MPENLKTIQVLKSLKTTKIDPNFKFEVAKMPGGESIKYCFQCGKCTATCPIRRFDKEYTPRLIIRATLLGLKDIVLSSDVIWLCATCYSCTERCPQGVKLTNIIRAIRNLAIEKGYIHPFFKLQANAIASYGKIYEDEEFINELRNDLGLPPVTPVKRDEVHTILQHTKVKKLLLTKEKEEN
jgi:heterodisulfide reductase subunit C